MRGDTHWASCDDPFGVSARNTYSRGIQLGEGKGKNEINIVEHEDYHFKLK